MSDDRAPGSASAASRGADPDDDAAAVARLAASRGWTVATAESLTSGAVASILGAAPKSSEWFRGAVVAYASEVKFDLLDVPRGPVVSRTAAVAMAQGACRRLGAQLAVGTTGAGGPDPQDGRPPGTVCLAAVWPGGVHAEEHHLVGDDPAAVVRFTTARAVALLRTVLEDPAVG